MKPKHIVWCCSIIIIAIAVVLIVRSTKHTDIDACVYTSKIRIREYFMGNLQSERIEDTEVSRWLHDEFDISGPIRFEDHGNAKSVAMTLPGNWLFLDELKIKYETNSDARPYIQDLIRTRYATDEPRITVADLDRLEARIKKP